MDDFQHYLDDQVRRLIGDGSKLPNAGKRLDLDADRYTPDELKLAHKMLKDNDYVPTWIAETRELDELREALVTKLHAAMKRGSVAGTLNADIAAFNKRVLSFNLKAPQGVAHKRMIDVERERQRLTSG